jgi:hypothetical protein
MSKKTRTLTMSALFSALTVVSLYFASIWPTGLFGIVAFSSLFVAAAVIETGVPSGIYVYVISSVLGMLLLPNRAAPLLYIAFFGYYPVVKSLIEKIKGAASVLVLKLIVFNAALTIIWFFMNELILGVGKILPGVFLMFLAGSVVFVIFDYGYSKLIRYYIERVYKYTNKGKRQ